MEAKVRIFNLALAFSIITGCDTDEPAEQNNFPLSAGDEWKYHFTTDADFLLPEQTIIIRNIGLTEIDGQAVYEFVTTTLEEPEFQSSHFYFQEQGDLKLKAYQIQAISDANLRSSKWTPAVYLYDFSCVSDTITAGDLVNENSPRIVLDFPLKTGKTWNHWHCEDQVFITKTVTGTTSITVPAGTFSCFEISFGGRLYDDSGIKITEYVSDIGLIKRVMQYEMTLTDSQGHPTDTVMATREVRLVEYNIR